jgi:hypothetical protein
MKPAVKYGLLSGVAGIFVALLMYITGLNRNPSGQWIGIVEAILVPALFMYAAVKEVRLGSGGWISFGTAFRQAFMVGLIGTAIGMVFHMIYLNLIDPTFLDYQKEMQYQQMLDRGLGEEAAEKQMARAAMFMKPHMQALTGLVMFSFLNAIQALVIAGIAKKPNPEIA